MSDFRFDPVLHQYTLDGRLLPGVTSVCQPLSPDFSMVDPEVLQAKTYLGIASHKACELDDTGELDESTVADLVWPRLLAWRKFKAENEHEWFSIEQKLFNAKTGHAGTQDRMGTLRRGKSMKTVIVDIKTVASLGDHIGVQLSGYELLEPPKSIEVRLAVQLLPNGEYRMKEYPDETVTFLSLLNVHHWRAKHGTG